MELRFQVGDCVYIKDGTVGSQYCGERGDIINIDQDDFDMPYEIQFYNGDSEWYRESELEPAYDEEEATVNIDDLL